MEGEVTPPPANNTVIGRTDYIMKHLRVLDLPWVPSSVVLSAKAITGDDSAVGSFVFERGKIIEVPDEIADAMLTEPRCFWKQAMIAGEPRLSPFVEEVDALEAAAAEKGGTATLAAIKELESKLKELQAKMSGAAGRDKEETVVSGREEATLEGALKCPFCDYVTKPAEDGYSPQTALEMHKRMKHGKTKKSKDKEEVEATDESEKSDS